jgi:hypothetical protein
MELAMPSFSRPSRLRENDHVCVFSLERARRKQG